MITAGIYDWQNGVGGQFAQQQFEAPHVRFVPKADSCSAAKRIAFDHLVGGRITVGGKANPRALMAELFPGLEVFDALRRQAVCEIR